MIMLMHLLRTLTRPYYIALGQTIGAFVYRVIAGGRAATRSIVGLDRLMASAARNTDRETLRIAVEHWAHRVASPASVAATASMFSDVTWFQQIVLELARMYPGGGSGLAFLQQALKDNRLIDLVTLREENERLGLANAG